MAISFVSNSPSWFPASSGSSSTFTVSGSNPYIVFDVLCQPPATAPALSYGGTAMTQLASVSSANVSGGEFLTLFGLANPASGSNNLVATWTGGAATVIVDGDLYNGAQQTTPVEATNTNSGSGASATVSVVTLTNNDWLVGFYRSQVVGSAGANTVDRGVSQARDMIDTGVDQTPAGTHTMTMTLSANQWAMIATAIKPFVAAAVGTPMLATLGAGS